MKAISSIKPMGGGLKPPVAIPPPAATLDDIPAGLFEGEEELEGRQNKNAKRSYTASGIFGQCEFTAEEVARIEEEAKKPLPKKWAKSRKGQGQTNLTYIEGFQAVRLMNEVFGLFSWSSQVIKAEGVSHEQLQDGKHKITVQCVVRITLKNGTFREGTGAGIGLFASEAEAWEKALKEAETDAQKRAIKNFGEIFGNCLYDKAYHAQ